MEEENKIIIKKIVIITIIVALLALICASCAPNQIRVYEEKDVAVLMEYKGKQGYWISKEKFVILAEKAIDYDYLMQNNELNKQLIYNKKQQEQPKPVVPVQPKPEIKQNSINTTKIQEKPNF